MSTAVDLSKPVIWTTKGNLNECDCEIYIEWIRNDEEVIFIKHVFHCGELVKREPHILKLKGFEAVGESAPKEGTRHGELASNLH
jgi:hypothetical protein